MLAKNKKYVTSIKMPTKKILDLDADKTNPAEDNAIITPAMKYNSKKYSANAKIKQIARNNPNQFGLRKKELGLSSAIPTWNVFLT